MRKLALILSLLMCLGLEATFAQTRSISGMITGADDGQPIPGASVSIKGTTTGSITNVEGKYLISVPSDATILVFSFVGMKTQEVAVAGKTSINVILESEVFGVDEVVVTALGIKKSQKALGYSATEFKSEDLERGQVFDATQALQGRVAGVVITPTSGAPGASTSVIVRGLSSITQSNQPLYVIDGVPVSNERASGNSTQSGTNATATVDFGNAASDINPSDIESINVLKGAAATSLYGARAANGAIIITTKSGKLNQKMRVDLSSSVTVSDVARLPYYQSKYGQGWSGVYNSQENGSWGPMLDGKMRLTGNVVDNSQRLAPFSFQENSLRDFYEYGYGLNNSIAISGGGDIATYYASYANAYQDGIIPGESDLLNRNSLTFRGQGGTDKTKIGFSTMFVNKKISANSSGQGDDAGAGKTVYQEIMQVPVNHYLPLYRDYNNSFDNLDNYFTAYGQNPYYIVNENGNDFEQNRIVSNLNLRHEINKNLSVSWEGGIDHYSNFYKRWAAKATIDNDSPNGSANDVAGMVQEEGRNVSQVNSDLLVNYSNKLDLAGKRIEYDLVLGNNVNQRTNKRLTTISKGLVVPGYYNVANISGSADVSTYEMKRRSVGLFGTLSLNYEDFIYLQLTGRNDWSSTLPPSDNSFFYPGFNSSFVFSELIADKSILSFGKLRLGYALAGNDGPAYALSPYYNSAVIRNGGYGVTNYPVAGKPAYEKNRKLGNPTLKNELSKEFEIGADLRFFKNRIGVDVAYYNKVTEDLIFDATIPASSGFDLQTTNLGQITNEGIELKLDLVPIQSRDFTWDFTYIFTQSTTVVDKLAPELGVSEYVINSAYETEFVIVPGKELGLFRIPDYKYSPNGDIIVGSNGLPLEGDKIFYASALPKYKMSFINTLTYKGLSFSFMFDYQNGGAMYSNTANSAFWGGNGEQSLVNDRRPWVIPNTVQEIKNSKGEVTGYSENATPITPNNWHEYYSSNTNKPIERNRIVDKTYLKLREITLNYKIPSKIANSFKLSSASVGVFANNVFLWTPATNSFIDPETSTFGNDIEGLFGEFDGGPSVRSCGAKLNLSF